MKLPSIITILLVISFRLDAQERFRIQTSYLMGESNTSLYVVQVAGYGSNLKKCELDAGINLIKTILFRGIPGSPQDRPLLGTDEAVIVSKNKQYFDELFEGKRYQTFLSTRGCGPIQKSSGQKFSTCKIGLYVQSLREDLVKKRILSEYGF